MRIDTLAQAFRKAWATNANPSSFESRVPTTTEPTNDGVIALGGADGTVVSLSAVILPYGLGSDNDVFDMRAIGWRHIGASQGTTAALWVPTILGQFTCTVGAAVGVAAAGGQTPPVLNTERFADTIVIGGTRAALQPRLSSDNGTAAEFDGTVAVFSPGSDLIAYIVLPLLGCEKLELTFDQTTGTPTCNALVALL